MRLAYTVLNNFRNLTSLYRALGGRWLVFRIAYALRLHTGLIRRQMPAYAWKDRPLKTWVSEQIPSTLEEYARWRRQNSPRFFFERAEVPAGVPWDRQLAVAEAQHVLDGELKYFSHTFVRTGFPPDWHKDPFSGKKIDANRHWSQISHDADVDIKFIWEASRFGMVYPLLRAYASGRDEKYAQAFWELIEAWAESNPPNTGPNWMDGQEAALRLLSWVFGFYSFLDSAATTPARIARFTVLVAAHADRIHRNIGYAISTHSNHTISEAFGLWLTGLLFPELKNAKQYLALGRRLLEQEAAVQIFPDGSYAMYSLNYHRFVLHLYLCAIRLSELNQSSLSELIRQRVSASIDYLSQLIDPESGQMPVYGSNDAALVLPLNSCDVTDYRPLLQLGSFLIRKEFLFEPGAWDEDIFWLCSSHFLPARETGLEAKPTHSAFPHGGTYVLRGTNSKAIIRCTDFRARPSHADQLHVDIWWRGTNIACDAGTYLYSGKGIWRNGLAHTWAHNTVTVDRLDQMKMVSRFTWTNWARGRVLKQDDKIWQGEHDGYRRLADPVRHVRTVLALREDRWLVVDHLEGRQPHQYALHWLLVDSPYERQENSLLLSLDSARYRVCVGMARGTASFFVVRGDPKSTRGWRSRYYGDKQPAISVQLETKQSQVIFWSFFGLEDDSVELEDHELRIRFAGGLTRVDLRSPLSGS